MNQETPTETRSRGYDNSQFRLNSIHKTSKLLGIRSEAVNKLIQEGKLRSVQVNGKIKIPQAAIQELINAPIDNPTRSIRNNSKEPNIQNRIEKIIKRHS